MYAKNETDFYLSYDEKRNVFSISIGTFSNNNQSIVDCLMYLKLNDDRDKETFTNELNKYNNLFIDNKDKIIKDIKDKGLNLYNVCFGYYEIDEFLCQMEYEDKKQKLLKDDCMYIIDDKKTDEYLETKFKQDLIDIIKESNNIVELWKKCIEIKEDIREHFFNNVYDFITTTKEE